MRASLFCVTLLLVASLFVTSLLSVSGAVHSYHRPHGNRNVPHQPIRPANRPVKTKTDSSYSPVMAYHEEPQRPPRPLYEAQWDVEDFHTSGNYDTEMSGVVSNAKLFAAAGAAANNSLWVFDIDETSLSGYTEMLSIGFGYVSKLNKEWILNASAPAIPQTLALYQQLMQSGFKVAFLTGRTWDEADATAENLQKAGYTGYTTLLTRNPNEVNLTATVYKSNRRTQLVEDEGYDIVGCIGDQWSDLHGPYTGYKVKLPNYIYFLP